MIPIPDSLTMKRSRSAEKLLYDSARAWLTAEFRAPGTHASDLLDPRQAVYRRLSPTPLSDREVGLFLVGKVLHAFVLQTVDGLAAVDINVTDEGSRPSDLGFSYSPDKILGGTVRELKTNRVFKEPKDIEDMQEYVEQILIYMAATSTREAQLWVLFLNLRDEQRRTTPVFRGYDLSISDEDLERLRAYCKETAAGIDEAVSLNNPHLFPVCREWKCNRKFCPYFDQCQPEGRWEPISAK